MIARAERYSLFVSHREFESLVSRFSARVRMLLRGFTHRKEIIDELEQDLWERVYRNYQFIEDRGGPSPLVSQIARNLGRSYFRKKKEVYVSRDIVHDRDSDHASKTPESEASHSEEVEMARAMYLSAIRKLTPAHRQMIDLRYVHGMGQTEISEVLGLPKGTVSCRTHRAEKMLGEILGIQIVK